MPCWSILKKKIVLDYSGRWEYTVPTETDALAASVQNIFKYL